MCVCVPLGEERGYSTCIFCFRMKLESVCVCVCVLCIFKFMNSIVFKYMHLFLFCVWYLSFYLCSFFGQNILS